MGRNKRRPGFRVLHFLLSKSVPVHVLFSWKLDTYECMHAHTHATSAHLGECLIFCCRDNYDKKVKASKAQEKRPLASANKPKKPEQQRYVPPYHREGSTQQQGPVHFCSTAFLVITENVRPLCTLFPEIAIEMQHNNGGCDFQVNFLPDVRSNDPSITLYYSIRAFHLKPTKIRKSCCTHIF